VAVGRDEAEELVGLALGEEAHRDLRARIDGVDAAQGCVELRADPVDEGAEAALVEEVDGLGRQVDQAREARVEGVGHQEVAEGRHQVEEQHHHAAGHGGAVAPEAQPDQLPLRGAVLRVVGGDPLGLCGQDPALELQVRVAQLLRLFLHVDHV
jgi:hypothetical protein